MKESADGCPMFEESDCNMLSGEVMCSSISLNKANILLRKWFEVQTVVYNNHINNMWKTTEYINETHTARLIAVRPIKDSADKVLKDMLDWEHKAPSLSDLRGFVERARKLLSGED